MNAVFRSRTGAVCAGGTSRRGGRGVARRSAQRGWVSVEMAFAALGVGLAAVFLVGVFGVGLAQIRCGDAAAEIARQAARDDLGAVQQIESRLPGDSTVQIGREGDDVVASVSIQLRPWGRWLPSFQVRSTASVAYEGAG